MSSVPRDKWQILPDAPWEEFEEPVDFSAFWAPSIPEPDADGVVADDGVDLVDERDDFEAVTDPGRLPPMRSVTIQKEVHFKLAGLPMVRTYTVIASQRKPVGP